MLQHTRPTQSILDAPHCAGCDEPVHTRLGDDYDGWYFCAACLEYARLDDLSEIYDDLGAGD